jgi:Uma2 family endonuclease
MDNPTFLPARHRLHVDDYRRMVDSGLFGKDDRIELIDGDLIGMAPIGQGHAATVAGLAKALFVACGDRAIVWPQNPVLIDQWSEPQPDLAVLRPRADFYATGERPGPADVLLVVEVANGSLRFDRGVKLPLYARAGWRRYGSSICSDASSTPTGCPHRTPIRRRTPTGRVNRSGSPWRRRSS